MGDRSEGTCENDTYRKEEKGDECEDWMNHTSYDDEYTREEQKWHDLEE